MAARIRKTTLSEEWKAKIQAGAILTRLVKHVNGEIEMTSSQIKAADILLKKTIPDLARSEVTGADGGPQEHVVTWQK
jgi:site-specific recombinase